MARHLLWNTVSPFSYDVQIRSPCVAKAEDVLGFTTKISLEESVDEVITWMKEQNEG
jgi:nucleoside-diphosphate-sugar epimerase